MIKLNCDITRDLLPSYVDGLTSRTSSEAIEAHLAECPACRSACDAMQDAASDADAPPAEDTVPEIDYLKKIRAANRKRIFAASFLVLLLAGLGILTKIYVYGTPIDDFHMMLISSSASDDGQTAALTDAGGETREVSSDTAETLVFSCWIENSSGLAFSHYKLKETSDGLDIIVYAAPLSPFHRSRTFQVEVPVTYDPATKERSPAAISIKGDTYGSNGLVTQKAKALYAARNPYIGDISADQQLANLLGVSETIGGYKNKLYTEKTEGFEYPYSWELIFDRPWTDGYDKIYSQKMRSYAYALIALIENCGEIKWTYRDAEGLSHTESITLADWDTEYPSDSISPGFRLSLKDYAAYDYRVQYLLNRLDIF